MASITMAINICCCLSRIDICSTVQELRIFIFSLIVYFECSQPLGADSCRTNLSRSRSCGLMDSSGMLSEKKTSELGFEMLVSLDRLRTMLRIRVARL